MYDALAILNRDGVVQGLPSAWHVVHPTGKRLSPLALAFKTQLLAEMGQPQRLDTARAAAAPK